MTTPGGGAVAIVPARGGSKRIPRKNIRPFLGVPLLVRAIQTLHASGVFERVIVTTDDDEVAEVGRRAGAEIPFMRPRELADDHTATIPVIAHAVSELERLGYRPAYACCVYPAAVLVTAEDYQAAGFALIQSGADYVFTATSFGFPIQRALRQLPDGACDMYWPEHRSTRSQDLPAAFHDAGQFYFGKRESWLEGRAIFSPRSRMHILPRSRVQDIDTQEDWERAEILFELWMRQSAAGR